MSSTNAKSRSLQQRLDLGARDPGEIAGDGVLDGAGGNAVIERLLQIAVEQTVDQAGREGIAGAETIDNFDLISARPQDAGRS